MLEKIFQIKNKSGLHARPAAKFVELTGKYNSRIIVSKDGQEVNGKSIMGLMMLEASRGSKLYVTADGPDAEQFLDEIEGLVNNKFGED